MSYNCPYCNRKYKTSQKYEMHIKTHGSDTTLNKSQTRNYDIAPEKPAKKLLKCPVPTCNKKYQNEDKRKSHVEKEHYFDTRNQTTNFSGISLEHDTNSHQIKGQIYELTSEYVKILHRINQMTEEMIISIVKTNSDAEIITCAKNLLPHKQEISSDELLRISVAQFNFAKRIFTVFDESCDWTKVMKDLKSFFEMGLPYYDTNFCPTILVDLLLHSLMQDNKLYTRICLEYCKENYSSLYYT